MDPTYPPTTVTTTTTSHPPDAAFTGPPDELGAMTLLLGLSLLAGLVALYVARRRARSLDDERIPRLPGHNGT